jgi:hypothetical protein
MQNDTGEIRETVIDGIAYVGYIGGRLYPIPSGAEDGTPGSTGGDGGTDGGAGGSGGSDDGGEGNEPPTKTESKTFTQEDVDALIGKRLAQERRQWEADAKQAAEREKMDEAERLKAEKADAEKAAADRVAAANQTLVKADAKVAAIAAGVKAERIDAFLRHVDTADIAVDDDGSVDGAAVKAAVDKALADVPEFKAAPGTPGRSGGELDGGGTDKPSTLADAINARLAKTG